eukprot:gene12418-biopygen8529
MMNPPKFADFPAAHLLTGPNTSQPLDIQLLPGGGLKLPLQVAPPEGTSCVELTSFWATGQGLVPYIAGPFTASQLPMPRRRSCCGRWGAYGWAHSWVRRHRQYGGGMPMAGWVAARMAMQGISNYSNGGARPGGPGPQGQGWARLLDRDDRAVRCRAHVEGEHPP